ncbi:MAG: protein BatD [Sedimentisphaerales bacterium]|nr:protein BatD [Sedimentisphaerales bacterium]
MNFLAKNALAAFAFLTLLTSSVAAQVRVFAQVDKSADIYIGENFGYHIIIDGENKPGQVDLSPLAKYNPQSAGNRDVSQTSISIINGRTTQNVIKQFVMSYSLAANQEGRIVLPPVTVNIDGKSYQTNSVEVDILKPGTTDQLDLEVTLSEQQCYVGQPVIMTIKFYISADIGDFRFNIPAFTSDAFYLEEPDISNPQAKEYDLGNGTTVFVTQYRTTHKGKDSILLTFSKVLIPRYSGDIEISPTSVSADVVVGRARSRNRFFDSFFEPQKEYKRFMVGSQPLKLTVLPLPEKDKPASFYGLVGKYTISASAAPIKVNVGDPITLTIKIGGSNYLKPVQWPALEQLTELAQNFKIPSERASPAIENGFKVFTQTIRANNDKVTEIPPVPLAYFDADKGAYAAAKTEPIKLEVSPSKVLTSADLEGGDFTPINKEVEAIKKGLSANYEDAGALINQTFSPLSAAISPGYAVIWAAPLVLVIASAVIKSFTHTTAEKIAARRKRSAAGKAINQLKRISSADARQRHELLAFAMKQYIGDRFDKVAGSLTGDDCREVIIAATQDGRTADRFREIIVNCEAARYAAIEAGIDSALITEVIKMIQTIDKKSRK